jgi:hypothetical protein
MLLVVPRPRPQHEPVTFKEVAQLINLNPVTHVDVDAPLQDEPGWTLYPARHTVQRQSYEFFVLYLKADATNKQLQAAHRAASAHIGKTDVVYAPSLSSETKALEDLFAGRRSLGDTRTYFRLFLETELEPYAANLQKAYAEQPYYVPPVVQTPSGMASRFDSVLAFVRSEQGVGEADGQRLGVVLAEAGQGKTFHSQYLASLLTKDWRSFGKRLPIYIDATQWSRLSTEDLSSVTKVIFHALRHFGCPLAWIRTEEEEDQFLRTALRLDLFSLIFDGFDEYVLWNPRTNAAEALDALVQMAAVTTARIVVTSRTSFWNAEVLPQRPDVADHDVFPFELRPFDRNHARNYFGKRFGDDTVRVDRAVGVFDALDASDPAMAGRGFVLHLVADLFDKGHGQTPTPQKGDIVDWLMVALCERERTRQAARIETARPRLAMTTASRRRRGSPPQRLRRVFASSTAQSSSASATTRIPSPSSS